MKVKSSNMNASGIGGKLFITIFFLVFGILGSVFVGILVHEGIKACGLFSWKTAPCRIVESRVVRTGGENPYGVEFQYEYEYGGRLHRNNRYALNDLCESDYTKCARVVERLAPGKQTVCYVNQDNPDEAVLKRGFPFTFLIIPFPMIFVVIGFGGLYMVWGRGGAARRKAISSKIVSKGTGKKISAVFFGVFLCVGLVASMFLLFGPLVDIINVRSWVETDCRIVSSHLVDHRGDDSTTYSADILFEYEFDGKTYRCNRVSMISFSTSNRSSVSTKVKRYKQGMITKCWVNPKAPLEAVLSRKIGWEALLALVPLVFIAVGGIGLFKTLKGSGSPASTGSEFGRRDSHKRDASGMIVLKATKSAAKTFWFLLMFSVIWNGVVAIMVVKALESIRSGRTEVILVVFMVIFGLVGLGVIGGLIHAALALLNARPVLKVDSDPIAPGRELKVQWRLHGKVERVTRLRIALLGREEATYRRGTRSYTDRETFAEYEIMTAGERHGIESGYASILLPPDTIHSFKSTHNAIKWFITVNGEIDKWPDIDNEYAITVTAHEA